MRYDVHGRKESRRNRFRVGQNRFRDKWFGDAFVTTCGLREQLKPNANISDEYESDESDEEYSGLSFKRNMVRKCDMIVVDTCMFALPVSLQDEDSTIGRTRGHLRSLRLHWPAL